VGGVAGKPPRTSSASHEERGNTPEMARVAMGLFDNGPLGPWPEEFEFKGEGCAFYFISFIIFLALVLVVSHYFF
jgi:hypothetical protein